MPRLRRSSSLQSRAGAFAEDRGFASCWARSRAFVTGGEASTAGSTRSSRRAGRRHDPGTGAAYPWLAHSTAEVNHYYICAVNDDFGPFFLKFCSYFPYNATKAPRGSADRSHRRPLDVRPLRRHPDGADPRVGQLIMEELDLVADGVTRTLGPRPESPDRPLLRCEPSGTIRPDREPS